MSFWRRPVVKRIAGGLFLLWLLVISVYQSISAIYMLVTRQAQGGAVYGFFYSVLFGGAVLLFLKPITHLVAKLKLPSLAIFLIFGSLFCNIEELFCYVTQAGIWTEPKPFYPWYIVGTGALVAWVFGVYLVVNYLKLGKLEVLIITGAAGWFQEVMIFSPGGLFAQPIMIVILPWTTWTYAILVLIPVSVAYLQDRPVAHSGLWWRYVLAFVIPLAVTTFGFIPLQILVTKLLQ